MKSRNWILVGLAVVVIAGLILANRPDPQTETPTVAVSPSTPVAQPAPAAQPSQPAPSAVEPHADRSPSQADLKRVPHFHNTLEEAGTLPKVLPASYFHIPVVQKAYVTAARIPKVLALQPCYCWCDKIGHGSLLDCFATEHGAG